MKRFWLFTYDSCYPSGGMYDFEASFDTLEEAEDGRKKTWVQMENDKEVRPYYNILDSETLKLYGDNPNDQFGIEQFEEALIKDKQRGNDV